MKGTEILKVLVGSRAHGLHREDSDYDYRGVFVVPTSQILSLNQGKIKNTSWIEGEVDNTSWELGHFLNMATHCNPTILEVFLSPVENETEDGKALRGLFDAVWNVKGVVNAFIGYGLNQRKKFLDDKDNRGGKYACAYLRTLYAAYQLLKTGTFDINIENSEIFESVVFFKTGNADPGDVISICIRWEKEVKKISENCKKETDYEAINKFLLEQRQKFW